MADCYITTLLIIYIALYEELENMDKKRFIATSVIIIVLTLIRPYFVVLWLTVLNVKNKKQTCLECLFAIFSLLSYFIMSNHMTAPYLSSLIDFDWLKLIIWSPIEGIRNLITIILDAIISINEDIVSAFMTGDDVGLQYFLFYMLTLIFIVFILLYKDKWKKWIMWIVVNISIWFTIVLLYDISDGSRHLMPFIIMEGILIINECRFSVNFIISVITLYLCFIKLTDSYFMTYPLYNNELADQLVEMSGELNNKININAGSRWDNTVLWVLWDTEGGYPWQTLYALPAGMGINLCTYEYTLENFEGLKARYIAVTKNGDISALCNEADYKVVLDRNDCNILIYQRY